MGFGKMTNVMPITPEITVLFTVMFFIFLYTVVSTLGLMRKLNKLFRG